MNAETVIKFHANEWRNLLAWGAPLPAKLQFKPWKGGGNLGWARDDDRKAMIRITGNIAEDLGTVLHELAHLAAPRFTMHELAWRQIFVRSVCEVTAVDSDDRRFRDFDLDVTITDLDAQVVDSLDHWLQRTGRKQVLKAIGVWK